MKVRNQGKNAVVEFSQADVYQLLLTTACVMAKKLDDDIIGKFQTEVCAHGQIQKIAVKLVHQASIKPASTPSK